MRKVIRRVARFTSVADFAHEAVELHRIFSIEHLPSPFPLDVTRVVPLMKTAA